ncbi:MAG TPA: tetratricopeptide repeat protein [Candidatus Limnocylindrales bacterium]|nr:tetratricopeptide repeat protein [Candidatus Limnocylindrales bacterium]
MMTTKTYATRRSGAIQLAFLLMLLGFCAAAASAQTQQLPKFDFRAVHYDVQASLHPAEETLTAEATVELVAKSASRTILVELHPDLHVDSVKLAVDGRKLSYQRDSFNPLDLEVTLPSQAQLGMHVTLIFDYSGAFSNDEDSPTKNVRFAWIDKNSAYLLLPARWFPLTDYPSNRYTATFQITVPDTFAVAGTGESSTPSSLPAEKPGGTARSVYTFNCKDAGPVGTFVAGDLQLSPVRAQGIGISVFAPPTARATAAPYGDELANILTYYSSEFDALPSPNMTLAQLPDGTVDGFSAPGLLLLSARDWGTTVNQAELAHLAAEQWWDSQVLPASPGDAWVTDGLAQYVSAMYLEHSEGEPGFRHQLSNYAVGAVMFQDAAPIAQAQNLQPYSQQYQSVVVDKGAMVFHMLRTSMGDAAFNSLLHDFYIAHAGKTASIDDFEKLTQTKLPAQTAGQPQLNLLAFFSQWLDSTGIPEFKMDYIVYRTPKGFKVVGKVTQPLVTFNMPVEIRVDTEGNPVTRTVQVVGTSTPFTIDTFGEPKPGGISIDPDDNLLKSSPRLHVQALIARGEGLAEQGNLEDAIRQYQKALLLRPNDSLADFRIGEAFFYQKNYSAAADSFRSALDGDLASSSRWVEVWSHIYLGKIFDLTGSRERAINEYQRAEELKDNTGGAQQQAEKYMKVPYTESGTKQAATAKPVKPS